MNFPIGKGKTVEEVGIPVTHPMSIQMFTRDREELGVESLSSRFSSSPSPL